MSNLFKFAENILNNLDHSTQTSIQNIKDNKLTTKGKSGVDQSNYNNITNDYSSSHYDSNTNQQQKSYIRQNSSYSSFPKSSGKKSGKKSKEDELIDFLNSDNADSSKGSSDLTSLKQPLMTRSMTEYSKNLSDNESTTTVDNDNFSEINSVKGDNDVEFIVGSEQNNDEQQHNNELASSAQQQQNDIKLNQILNENKKLKSEIQNLNNEIKSLSNRFKTTEDEFHRSKRKVEHFQSQISESDKIIRELRSREDDMSESIKSKESQIAVLRVKFEECDKELKNKKVELDNLKKESERLLKEHSNSSDIQSQAFDTLKEKLNEYEINLQREKDAYINAQREYMSIQNQLEAEKQDLTTNLQLIEKKLNEEKNRVNDLTNQLKVAKTSSNSLKQELEDYKSKATKILQSKDKLIASLKDGVVNFNEDDSGNDNGNRINLKMIEIEELKNERDYLKEEILSKNSAIDLLKQEIQELEAQTSQEMDNLRDQIRNIQDNVLDEKQKKEGVESDLRNLRQELNYTQDELYKQKSSLNLRLQEREKEIEKLRNQLTAKTLSTTTEKELEDRLHSLTESLIQKQTLIEALQSEKHSLFLQLERSEKRLQDYENIVSARKTTVLNLNDDEENNSKHNHYFRESPYDHEVTRKVKRAATEIDKFSIRLGVFLKRYPIARIFVIIYMILLHLWVLIVLFTYKPEMHDSSYHHPALPKPNIE